MVDPVRLARLLQRLGEQLSVLQERAADRSRLRADEVLLSATKYRFVTAIGAMMDVAHHLLAAELWGPASSSADALCLLGRHGAARRSGGPAASSTRSPPGPAGKPEGLARERLITPRPG